MEFYSGEYADLTDQHSINYKTEKNIVGPFKDAVENLDDRLGELEIHFS